MSNVNKSHKNGNKDDNNNSNDDKMVIKVKVVMWMEQEMMVQGMIAIMRLFYQQQNKTPRGRKKAKRKAQSMLKPDGYLELLSRHSILGVKYVLQGLANLTHKVVSKYPELYATALAANIEQLSDSEVETGSENGDNEGKEEEQ